VKPVYIADAAETDLRAARQHYNAVSPALGDGFLLHVEDALDRLTSYAELYQPAFDEIRRIPLHRFPYNIFYRELPDRVEVIAVLHANRDPLLAQLRAEAVR
jgi:plasmid stabilization system protein ParE